MMSTASEARSGTGGAAHRIVVGVDGSDESLRALDWAAAQAERTGATLDIHTAYEPGYTFITHDEVERTMDRLIAEAATRVSGAHPTVTTSSGTHEDSPATVLIEAGEGADLLVIGTRGRGGFAGLLLGSVGQQCSLHAPCPVLIVR